MITTLLLSLSCSIAPATAAIWQEPEVVLIPSKIERVTVYPGQALIERVVEVNPTQTGLLNFRVGPLPLSAQPSSFQTEVLEGRGVVQGMELRKRSKGAMDWAESNALYKQLEEENWKERLLQTDYAGIEAGIATLKALIANPRSGDAVGADGLPVDAGERISFVRAQMTVLQRDLAEKDRDIRVVVARINDIRAQLDLAEQGARKDFREARIGLFIEQLGLVRLKVTYLVDGAWWGPAYDVRVAPDLTGVSVGLVGQVTQRTSEDWNGVALVLSTSTPNIGLDPPELPRLNYRVRGKDQRRRLSSGAVESMEVLGYVGSEMGYADASPKAKVEIAPTVSVQDLALSTQFVLPGVTSVRSNGEAHRFRIRELPLEVQPERYVVPSMSTHAYLRAKVSHTGDAPLLSGKAKVFLGPDYLGEATFPVLRQGDSTMLNLGIDPNLTVEWELLEDTRDNPGRFSLSDTATITRRYRATLHLSAAARSRVSVLIEEALPMSSDDRIEVEVSSLSPQPLADPEDLIEREERGVYRWRLVMSPGSTQGIRWGYELSFDEDLFPILHQD